MNNIRPDSDGETAETTTTAHTHETDAGALAAQKERLARGRAAPRDAEVEQAREVGAPESAVAAPSTGGRGRPRRLLLIGLDGATPELAIGAWRSELRTMHMLTDRGTRGRIRSSVPWSSAPAWLSLLSGQDPGQIGVYGPARRANHSYAAPIPLDSRAIHQPRLWNYLGDAGKHVGVVGAPATTPAPPVRGHLIGERAVDGEIATYPAALGQQVALWISDTPPAPVAASDAIELLIGQIYAHTEQRFRLARRLLARDTYDCFVLCDDGIAAMQRRLWDSLDVTHRRYSPNHPAAGAISAFYRFVDEQIGELLELIDDDTVIAVVSACGAQSLDGELALNDWLIAQGELTLIAPPARPAHLDNVVVDWERTRAWAADGAIYLNVVGREPQGIVPAAQIEPVCASLAERLRGLSSPHAARETRDSGPAVEVYRPAALYGTTYGIAPDLLAVCTQPGWRPTASVGYGKTWTSTRETAMDAACESPAGFFVVYDPHNLGGGRVLEEAAIYDIVPTLLALLGEPSPPRSRGRVLPGFEH